MTRRLPWLLLVLTVAAGRPTVQWDRRSLVLIQPGGNYGRMARTGHGTIVCCFEYRGRAAVRRSVEGGKAWGDRIDAAAYPGGSAANPELLAGPGGRLLLFYNGRPRTPGQPFTIGMATSTDDGRSWTPAARPLYAAGNRYGDGCYEPAAVQLPAGVIALYFANEHGHAADGTQAIDRMTSRDGGRTWSDPIAVAYTSGGRDGMPVPILGHNRRSVLLAIEDNGHGHPLQPTILKLPLTPAAPIGADDPCRWPAVTNPPWPAHAYAGAPYLRQFPNRGPAVLICQPGDGNPGLKRPAAYLGDATAHDFRPAPDPFPVDPGRPGQWNALFIKTAATVTAVSSITIGGRPGIWAIDGRLTEGH